MYENVLLKKTVALCSVCGVEVTLTDKCDCGEALICSTCRPLAVDHDQFHQILTEAMKTSKEAYVPGEERLYAFQALAGRG